MTSDQPIHFDEKITRPIFWGKLSFPKRLEMLQYLQSKSQLTVQDCEDCIASLENTHLNHLLDTDTQPDPNFSQVIQNTMTEIRLIQLNLEDFAEFADQPNQVDLPVFAQNDTRASLYKCVQCNNPVFVKGCFINTCDDCCWDTSCKFHHLSYDLAAEDLSDDKCPAHSANQTPKPVGGYAAMIYDMVKLYNSTDATNRSIHMEEKWVSISINGIKKHIQNEELLFFTGNYDLEQVKVQLQSRFQGKGNLIFNE